MMKKIITILLMVMLIGMATAAPSANAGSDTSVTLGNSVFLSASSSTCSSCSITSYIWNFDDESSDTGQSVSHTYSNAGVYSVTLIVLADDGSSDSDTVQVTVTSADSIAPTISHTAIDIWSKDSALPISAAITDNVGVTSATLYYKKSTDASYTSSSMSASGSSYSATIPSSVFDATTHDVEYYISATDGANTKYSPTSYSTSPNSITITATDSIPPTTSLVSIAADTESAYWDATDDSLTQVVVLGESGMSCRYSTTDTTYSSMPSSNVCTVSGSQATCSIPNLVETDSTSYNYSISCKDASGNEQNSAQNLDVTFGVDYTAPTNQDSVGATQKSSGKILVEWDLPTDSKSGILSQKIYRSTDNSTYSLVSTTTSTATSWMDSSDKTHGETYFYKLKAVDVAGNESALSSYATRNADSVGPSLTVTKVEEDSSSASFYTNDDTNTQVYVNLGETGGTNCSYSGTESGDCRAVSGYTVICDVDTSTDQNYSLEVSCDDAAGNTGTVDLYFERDLVPPNNVTNLDANPTTSTVELSWTHASGNYVSYNIYLDDSLYTSTSAATKTLSGLSSSTNYEVIVKTVDRAGNESSGVEVDFETDAQVVETTSSSGGGGGGGSSGSANITPTPTTPSTPISSSSTNGSISSVGERSFNTVSTKESTATKVFADEVVSAEAYDVESTVVTTDEKVVSPSVLSQLIEQKKTALNNEISIELAKQIQSGLESTALVDIFGVSQEEATKVFDSDPGTETKAAKEVISAAIDKSVAFIEKNSITIASQGRVIKTSTGEDKTEITLKIENLKGNAKEISIVQEIPKELVATASLIKPATPGVTMRIIKDDPIVAFIVEEQVINDTTEIKYVINAAAQEQQIAQIPDPLIIPVEEVVVSETKKIVTNKAEEKKKVTAAATQAAPITAQGDFSFIIVGIVIVVLVMIFVSMMPKGKKEERENPFDHVNDAPPKKRKGKWSSR